MRPAKKSGAPERRKKVAPDSTSVDSASVEESPDGGSDVILHIRLPRDYQQWLKTVVTWMLSDPAAHRIEERLSYAGALRYSLRQLHEHPPAHVKVGAE